MSKSAGADLDDLNQLPWESFPNLALVVPGPMESALTPSRAAKMLYELAVIRMAEQWLVDNETLVHGPLHSSIGQEAVAVGVVNGLQTGDQIASTHRAHHHVLAKVVDHASGAGFDVTGDAETPAAVRMAIYRTLCEILGLRDGFAGGRGGSAHLSDIASGVLGTSAIVGGGVPMATGAAFAFAQRGTGNVAVAFLGDGASSIGAFHESVSLAKVMSLPTIFVIENNLYSVATTVTETVGFPDIAIRAAGYNMPGLIADGMDPVAMVEATRLARQHAVNGRGPVMIEAKTYRFLHQSGRLPGSDYRYRTKDEEGQWMARDPLSAFPASLVACGLLDEAAVAAVTARAATDLAAVIDRCTTHGDDGYAIREDLSPDPMDATRGVLSSGTTTLARRLPAFDVPDESGEETTFANAISIAIHRAMERDPEVFVIGEEVGHLRGGAYGATRHACRDFPDRLFSAPISENGFSGLGLGAAMLGMRPIIELMFPDFALEGADQLLNHIPKTRYMFGGDLDVPVVVRARTAQGRGFGPQHSSDPAGLFALFPGWRIFAPSTPAEYVGLFNSAITGSDPVLIIEHHRLWPLKGRLPADGLDFRIPSGTARSVRHGDDVTVLTWSHPVHRVAAVAETMQESGIGVDLIDLRTLDETSIDMALIGESIRRTGAVAIVEDTMAAHSLGPRIAQRIHEQHFSELRHPVALVAGQDVPTPVSKVLEDSVLLSDEQIAGAIARLAGR